MVREVEMWNLMDDLRICVDGGVLVDWTDALGRVRELVAAYDALAPDWAAAPEWAQWYAVDADGAAHWCDEKPSRILGMSEWWDEDHRRWSLDKQVDLPSGIDWRLCIWRRPEAQ